MAKLRFSPTTFLFHIITYTSLVDNNSHAVFATGDEWLYTSLTEAISIDIQRMKTSMHYDGSLLLVGTNTSISQSCIREIVAGIPLEAYDAFGKPPSGILGQDFNWLGHYDGCVAIDGYQHSIADMLLIVKGNTSEKSLKFPASWGLCLPISCNEKDIQYFVQSALDEQNITWFRFNPDSPVGGPPGPIHINGKLQYDAGFICVVIACSFLGLFMVLGAALDVHMRWLETSRNKNRYQHLNGNNQQKKEHVPLLSEQGHSKSDVVYTASMDENKRTSSKPGLLRRFLLCFAFNRSIESLVNTKQGNNSISCLNGIRVISISWVILGHSVLYPARDLLYFYYITAIVEVISNRQVFVTSHRGYPCNGLAAIFAGMLYNVQAIKKSSTRDIMHVSTVFQNIPPDNTAQIGDFARGLGFTVVPQAEFAVDSFFFLSGCLVAYLTLDKMAKTSGKIQWSIFYIHRYLRLTPVYGAVIVFYLFLDPYIGYGPLWYRYTDHPNCSKYWWRNLLYINNFFTEREMCMTWSWYLPNDMQFFAISPVLLILLHRRPGMGLSLLSILTFLSVILKTILTNYYGAGNIFEMNANLTSSGFFNAIYDKPYTRIPPYLVGIAVGFVMVRRPHIRMRPMVVLIGWMSASIVGLVVIYVLNNTYYREWSRAEAVIYCGFSSFAWSVCLAWVVLACKNGYGGWINSFLSWNLWLPLGRLTYTVYLVHPIVIRTIYYSTIFPFRAVTFSLATMVTLNMVLAHGVAFLFAITIEYPFANLEKLLLPSNQKRQ